MRLSRMKIQLKVSSHMNSAADANPAENTYIRLPKAARVYYEAIGKKIEVSSGNGTPVVLEVREALRGDIKTISHPGEEKDKYGFVTSSTMEKITSKGNSKHQWVTENVDNLIVGSDPEFGLIDPKSGKFLYAAHTWPGDNEKKTQLGQDGPCMELRPPPTPDVSQHCSSIKKLFLKAAQSNINEYSWYTGATYQQNTYERRYTLGGHIHIGEPTIFHEFLSKLPENKKAAFRESLNRQLIRVLDDLVGLPFTRIDGPDAGLRRTSGNYGTFGDYRPQKDRVEWRTPSAIWLNNPELAEVVIATTKAVSEEFYRRVVGHKFDESKLFKQPEEKGLLKGFGCYKDDVVRQKLNYSSPKTVSDEELKSLIKRLKSLSKYKQYKQHICAFSDIISKEKANNILHMNTKENWLG